MQGPGNEEETRLRRLPLEESCQAEVQAEEAVWDTLTACQQACWVAYMLLDAAMPKTTNSTSTSRNTAVMCHRADRLIFPLLSLPLADVMASVELSRVGGGIWDVVMDVNGSD